MIAEDQREVIAFLSAPSTHGGAAVEQVETHASIVFLAGTRVWKLKRAVRYAYLDFSSVERRRVLCEAEVRINRRTAPEIYRGAVPVTREQDGSLAIGGSGAPVEWVIEMLRFDQEDLLDRRATQGRLDLRLMRPLARAIARFHRDAERRPDHGGAFGMAWVVDGNVKDLGEPGAGNLLDAQVRDDLASESRAALARSAPWLDARREHGEVRQCHGDLHLRNIVLRDNVPTLFDAVEFNDEIACIDVLYDLAFLLMDLWRRHLPQHANAVLNGYLTQQPDLHGLSLLPLFLSCRAAVRAKTSLAAAGLQDEAPRQVAMQEAAREYLRMALQLLRPPGPSVIAIGGLSGSGKSSLVYALAPSVGAVPGAVVLRSDEVRKRLLGVPELSRLGPEGYTPAVSRQVYEVLTDNAAAVARAGHAAIVDAVFARAADRAAIEMAAQQASVPFVGLWLDAPERLLLARVQRREGDASDADATVIGAQLAEDTGPITWHRVDGQGSPDDVAGRAAVLVRSAIGTGVNS